MPVVPPAQITEMFSLTENREKHIGEEDDRLEIPENRLVNPNISEFGGTEETYLAGVIASYAKILTQDKLHFLGYPLNLDFDYSDLAQLLHFHINNAGDPFRGRNTSGLDSQTFERWVLDWFASLWEIEKNEYWGYVTTGGTEGNLHGILVGRELFPEGILYASQESHYSVFKAARMYRIQCLKVGTLTSGQMDYANLKTLLLAHKDKPAIINVNIGTTLKGAIDDLDLVIQTLEESGYTQDQFYIHCDGALFGIMLPFVERAPRITFNKPIGSISISGHKFLGCPIPCGIVISRLKYADALSTNVEYIGSKDATITGSRSGHAPIFIWYALNKKGLSGLKKEVENCIINANYLKDRLRGAGIDAMLNEFSSTVVFQRPLEDSFCRRWNLACQGNMAHVVVLQHVSVAMLDSFVSEFAQRRSIWYQDGTNDPSCMAKDIGAENCVLTFGESHRYT